MPSLQLCHSKHRPSTPKAALLFLTAWGLPHASVWEAWLQDASHLVPLDASGKPAGNVTPHMLRRAHRHAQTCRNADPFLQQYLFSVYVHTSPEAGHTAFRAGSPFVPHLLAYPVATERGTHSLTVAAKLLLQEALQVAWFPDDVCDKGRLVEKNKGGGKKEVLAHTQTHKHAHTYASPTPCITTPHTPQDPTNHVFTLLSESCIPIYPPTITYVQLIHRTTSAVHACHDATSQRDLFRWQRAFANTSDAYVVHSKHWRKSSQWFTLLREHALLVAQEVAIDHAFGRRCLFQAGCWCISDEHYVPTVLASAGGFVYMVRIVHTSTKHVVGGHARQTHTFPHAFQRTFTGLENQTDCTSFGLTHIRWVASHTDGRPFTHAEVTAQSLGALRQENWWVGEGGHPVRLDFEKECLGDGMEKAVHTWFVNSTRGNAVR